MSNSPRRKKIKFAKWVLKRGWIWREEFLTIEHYVYKILYPRINITKENCFSSINLKYYYLSLQIPEDWYPGIDF